MNVKIIAKSDPATAILITVLSSSVSAGFPSPAEDYAEDAIDLNKHIVPKPVSTFFARANGDSMIDRGIHCGDMMVIDRARTPVDGAVVIAAVDGEFACKIMDLRNKRLISANKAYPPIAISDAMDCVIEGVVTHSIRYHI
jgi:DNA polymerase V|tara:strand:- start:589 stop:1011 length:423 start_codon:yes stop_codon:yes gene_type:complete